VRTVLVLYGTVPSDDTVLVLYRYLVSYVLYGTVVERNVAHRVAQNQTSHKSQTSQILRQFWLRIIRARGDD